MSSQCCSITSAMALSMVPHSCFQVKQLLGKWGKLHAVRTAVSILAFTGLTIAALKTAKK